MNCTVVLLNDCYCSTRTYVAYLANVKGIRCNKFSDDGRPRIVGVEIQLQSTLDSVHDLVQPPNSIVNEWLFSACAKKRLKRLENLHSFLDSTWLCRVQFFPKYFGFLDAQYVQVLGRQFKCEQTRANMAIMAPSASGTGIYAAKKP